MELKEQARLIALEICIRALIGQQPQDEIKELLEAAEGDVLAVMGDMHRDQGGARELAQLSLLATEHLFHLSNGLVGDPPPNQA